MKYPAFILLLILSFISSPLLYAQYSTDEGNAARTLWLKGFDVFEKAETAEKGGDRKNSVSLYRESLGYFQKVKNQYPKWNSALVEYRLKICERKIQALSADTAAPAAAP